jgi:lipoprotein Spr
MVKVLHRSVVACLVVSISLIACRPSESLLTKVSTDNNKSVHKVHPKTNPEFSGVVLNNNHSSKQETTTVAAAETSRKSKKVDDCEPQGITPAEFNSVDAKSKTVREGKAVVTYLPVEKCNDEVANREKINPSEANVLSIKYAGLLGVPPQYVTNYPLYHFIDEWYGVDYRLGGTNMDGIDCSAFVQRLYSEVYGTNVLRTALEQFNNCNFERKVSQLKEGDLVFFHIHSRHITHVGIYLMNNYFVHASCSQGVVISRLDDPYWDRYFAGGGKMEHDNG